MSEMRAAQPRLDIPRASSVYPDDVSPPDSPQPGEDGARSASPNVSPITDGSSGHRVHARLGSNNHPPLPHQDSSETISSQSVSRWREKIAAAKALTQDGQRKTMWDDYSGEPTGSGTGKTGQVEPRDTKFHQAEKSASPL